MYLLLLVPTIGLSFIRVIYADDWQVVTDDEKSISHTEAVTFLKKNQINFEGDHLLLPFFSTSCPLCRLTAMKMSISYRRGLLPKTILVFPEDEEKAIEFMRQTNFSGVPYITVDQHIFQELGGNIIPSIFIVSKASSEHYIGEQFNNIVLSNLASIATDE